MTKTIVAIGGGDMRLSETLAIDKEIIRLTGKARPKALLVPTASSDSPDYDVAFRSVYGDQFGCQTDVLYLLNVNPTRAELEEKILSSELIYVGGGNTLKMMRRWRRLGVDDILRTACERGIVLAGVSAGAICWFEYGHSDSMSFYRDDWQYIRVKCTGFVKGLCCPHYDSSTDGVPRKDDFHRMVLKYGGPGIAIDNNCAVVFLDDGYRVIKSQPGAKSYRVDKSGGEIITKQIEQVDELRPIIDLTRNMRMRRVIS